MSGFAERFTVSCSVCGFIQAFRTLEGAKTFATALRSKYENLTIFDRMARKGAPQEWEWGKVYDREGWRCKSTRPKDEPPKVKSIPLSEDDLDRDRYDYDNHPPIGAETMYESGYWQ